MNLNFSTYTVDKCRHMAMKFRKVQQKQKTDISTFDTNINTELDTTVPSADSASSLPQCQIDIVGQGHQKLAIHHGEPASDIAGTTIALWGGCIDVRSMCRRPSRLLTVENMDLVFEA